MMKLRGVIFYKGSIYEQTIEAETENEFLKQATKIANKNKLEPKHILYYQSMYIDDDMNEALTPEPQSYYLKLNYKGARWQYKGEVPQEYKIKI